MKTILCPLDFSKSSLHALLYAYDIALQSGAKLYLLHTYHIPVIVPLMEKHLHPEPAASMQYKRETQEKMENLIAWLNKIYAPACVSTTCRIVSNFTADEIVKISSEEHLDLIVMGTTETTELKDIFLKAPLIRIIEETNCPLLAIPANATYKKIDRIVYTTQADDPSSEELNFIAKFAALFGAEVAMLHTQKEVPAVSYAQQAKQPSPAPMVGKYPLFKEYMLTGQDVLESIYTLSQHKPTDLLVMTAHRRSLLEQILSKGSTHQPKQQLGMPVLLLR